MIRTNRRRSLFYNTICLFLFSVPVVFFGIFENQVFGQDQLLRKTSIAEQGFSTKERAIKIDDSLAAPSVRIRLKMSPYEKVVVNEKGFEKVSFKPTREMAHTLRSRLEEINHFYFAGWHVETNPVLWQKETKKYSVRLNFYKLYGQYADLEEKVGSIDVSGYLVGGDNQSYNLVSSTSHTFVNRNNDPVLKLAIGLNSKELENVANSSNNKSKSFVKETTLNKDVGEKQNL